MASLLNDAGKLNQKCTFYAIEEQETVRGTIKKTKVKKFTCWCNIRQTRLNEVQEAIGTGHVVKTTLIIRHRQKEEVQNDWLVTVKGREYEITSIIPDYETQMHDMIVLRDDF